MLVISMYRGTTVAVHHKGEVLYLRRHPVKAASLAVSGPSGWLVGEVPASHCPSVLIEAPRVVVTHAGESFTLSAGRNSARKPSVAIEAPRSFEIRKAG